MLNQFSRTQLLLGEEGMKKLAGARVAVFGIGGVGGNEGVGAMSDGGNFVRIGLNNQDFLSGVDESKASIKGLADASRAAGKQTADGLKKTGDAAKDAAKQAREAERAAKQAAQTMLDDYALLKSQYANKPKKRVFLQFGANPLFTSGKGSIQHEVLEVCGGENIFAGSRVPWPQVSREQVLARAPQAIVATGGPGETLKIEQYWGNQLKIPVITLNSDWFERASPRIILAAKQLCAALAESH